MLWEEIKWVFLMNSFSIQAVSNPFFNVPKFSAKTKVSLHTNGRSYSSLYDYPGVWHIEDLNVAIVGRFRNAIRRMINLVEAQARESVSMENGGVGEFSTPISRFEDNRVHDIEGGEGMFVISGNARNDKTVPVSGTLTLDLNQEVARYNPLSGQGKINTVKLSRPVLKLLRAASSEGLSIDTADELAKTYGNASFKDLAASDTSNVSRKPSARYRRRKKSMNRRNFKGMK